MSADGCGTEGRFIAFIGPVDGLGGATEGAAEEFLDYDELHSLFQEEARSSVGGRGTGCGGAWPGGARW